MTKGCKKCFQTNVWYYRCNECNAKQFQQDFPNWTSGNEFIDRFIQETQLNVQSNFIVIEWVPYNRFKNIEYHDKGVSGTIYKAI